MAPNQKTRTLRRDLALAGIVVAAGVAISAMSVAQLFAHVPQVMAQATPPLQSTPGAESKPSAPSTDTSTGTRPAAIPPQPAQPDAGAQKSGAAPVLPPAPAEKTAAPIPAK
jgi:hypothetical protein